MNDFALYGSTFHAALAVAALHLVQLAVADVAGIRAGHTAGMPVAGGHDSFHFRAVRAHANTNESLATFTLLLVAALGLAADPFWTSFFCWVFAAGRLVHMVAYYADLRPIRSLGFGVGALALLGLLVTSLA